jgi:tetratricopeptide (TPR) repeat protein
VVSEDPLAQASRLVELAELTDDEAEQRAYLRAARSLLAPLADAQPPDAESLFAIGYSWYLDPDRNLVRRRRIEEALHAALHVDPHHQLARMYLGHFYFDEGEYAKALEALRRVDVPRLLEDERTAWRGAKVAEGIVAAKVRLGDVSDLPAEVAEVARLYRELPVESPEEVPLLVELVTAIAEALRNGTTAEPPLRKAAQILVPELETFGQASLANELRRSLDGTLRP